MGITAFVMNGNRLEKCSFASRKCSYQALSRFAARTYLVPTYLNQDAPRISLSYHQGSTPRGVYESVQQCAVSSAKMNCHEADAGALIVEEDLPA